MSVLIPFGDDDRMPFGKFKGKRMDEVPSWYLDFVRDMNLARVKYPEVGHYIDRNSNIIDDDLRRAGKV